MPIKQFMIYVSVEVKTVTEEGDHYVSFKTFEVDLVNDDIADFISKIPEDINTHSQVWVAITPSQGKTLSYVDGMEREILPDDERGRVQRISDERHEILCKTATLFAERRLVRLQEETAQPLKNG